MTTTVFEKLPKIEPVYVLSTMGIIPGKKKCRGIDGFSSVSKSRISDNWYLSTI